MKLVDHLYRRLLNNARLNRIHRRQMSNPYLYRDFSAIFFAPFDAHDSGAVAICAVGNRLKLL